MCLLSLGTFSSYGRPAEFAPGMGFAGAAGKFLFSKNVVFAFGASGLSEYTCVQSKLFSNIAVRTQCWFESFWFSFSYYSVKLPSVIKNICWGSLSFNKEKIKYHGKDYQQEKKLSVCFSKNQKTSVTFKAKGGSLPFSSYKPRNTESSRISDLFLSSTG